MHYLKLIISMLTVRPHTRSLLLPVSNRSALAKFRCGVAPIRIETGRYEQLPEHERICPLCRGGIETELHVIMECSVYDCIRKPLLDYAHYTCELFSVMSKQEKFKYLFAHQDTYMIRLLAKTCCDILKCRNNILYSKNIN